MSKVAFIAKISAQEGKGEELVRVLSQMFDQVAREPGTEVYALHAAADNADTVWFYELYADQESLGAHGTSEAMKKVFAEIGGILAGPPEMHLLRPVQAKGLAVD